MSEERSDLTEEISTRPVRLPDDEPLLKEIYRSIRSDEVEAWAAMGIEQVERLLDMQYNAQQKGYEQAYPDAEHLILLYQGKAVGRCLSVRYEHEVRGVDIAVMAEYQNKGIGTAVLNSWKHEAAAGNRVFCLHVLKTNRAVELYLRMGLKIVGETGGHYAMEWRPAEGGG